MTARKGHELTIYAVVGAEKTICVKTICDCPCFEKVDLPSGANTASLGLVFSSPKDHSDWFSAFKGFSDKKIAIDWQTCIICRQATCGRFVNSTWYVVFRVCHQKRLGSMSLVRYLGRGVVR